MSNRTVIQLWILTITNLAVFVIGGMVLASNYNEPEKVEYVPVNPQK